MIFLRTVNRTWIYVGRVAEYYYYTTTVIKEFSN